MLGNQMQDEVLAKEAAKIAYRRMQNEKRRVRIHDAKQRTIGLDIEALDAQVAEKRANASDDVDRMNIERAQANEIERLLATSMDEERHMREFQMNQLKSSWEDAMRKRTAEREAPPGTDFDVQNCGPASLIVMKGEDLQGGERSKQAKEQMRVWIQQQIAEKAYMKGRDADENLNYADMIKAIDEIRESTEQEEKDMRRYVTDTVKMENLELAMGQKMRRHLQNSINDSEGKPLATSLECFTENKAVAMDEFGKVKRVDMFRGFTDEQKRTIFQENQDIIRENALRKLSTDQTDDEWVAQQTMAMRSMEQAAYDETMMRAQLKDEHLAFLRAQIQQQSAHRAEWDAMKNGAIGAEFFDSFGKDCR